MDWKARLMLTLLQLGQVWLAGRPGEAEAALREAGVDEFLYAGGDLLSALGSAHAAIGV